MSDLAFYAAVCSDVGNRRKNNEDNFSLLGQSLAPEECYGRKLLRSVVAEQGILGLFDGMGGESSGEVASQIAADTVRNCSRSLLSMEPQSIVETARQANQRICDRMAALKNHMGSTLSLLVFRDGACTGGNVGDSRIYILRGGSLMQLSRDHTAAQQMVDMGMLSPEAAQKDKRRNQLTQHLGIDETEMQLQPAIIPVFDLQVGDRLLLCSDGVTDALSDSDLTALLSQDTSCEKMAGGIVDSAMLAGSSDNVTALVVKVGRRERDSRTRGSRGLSEGKRAALMTWIWIGSGLLAMVWGALLALLL